jgi:hypothetical protein
MRLGCILRRLLGLILLVAGIGIILFSGVMMERTADSSGDGEPIDTTIQVVLAGQGPVNETVRVRGKLSLFKWTTEYEERGGQKRALNTVYDYSLSTVQDGDILILPIRSEYTLDEGKDVQVVGQLLHRAYGKTYVVNIEKESPIPAGWFIIAFGAVVALVGLLLLLRRG